MKTLSLQPLHPSGLELYSDLVLADFLITSGLASEVGPKDSMPCILPAGLHHAEPLC